ncbi:MAG: hypothetical protein IJ849_07830 [Selenomonadaceae bacterium]|nr:hypothetical protein [Selenomonadaceae bacterium]
MNFYPVDEWATMSEDVMSDLSDGQEVILTEKGRPKVLMLSIPQGGFDETVRAVRSAKAMLALESMRRRAAKDGFMSDEEINTLIDEARAAV